MYQGGVIKKAIKYCGGEEVKLTYCFSSLITQLTFILSNLVWVHCELKQKCDQSCFIFCSTISNIFTGWTLFWRVICAAFKQWWRNISGYYSHPQICSGYRVNYVQASRLECFFSKYKWPLGVWETSLIFRMGLHVFGGHFFLSISVCFWLTELRWAAKQLSCLPTKFDPSRAACF